MNIFTNAWRICVDYWNILAEIRQNKKLLKKYRPDSFKNVNFNCNQYDNGGFFILERYYKLFCKNFLAAGDKIFKDKLDLKLFEDYGLIMLYFSNLFQYENYNSKTTDKFNELIGEMKTTLNINKKATINQEFFNSAKDYRGIEETFQYIDQLLQILEGSNNDQLETSKESLNNLKKQACDIFILIPAIEKKFKDITSSNGVPVNLDVSSDLITAYNKDLVEFRDLAHQFINLIQKNFVKIFYSNAREIGSETYRKINEIVKTRGTELEELKQSCFGIFILDLIVNVIFNEITFYIILFVFYGWYIGFFESLSRVLEIPSKSLLSYD